MLPGIEPMTLRFKDKKKKNHHDWNRTYNPQNQSPALYPLGHVVHRVILRKSWPYKIQMSFAEFFYEYHENELCRGWGGAEVVQSKIGLQI